MKNSLPLDRLDPIRFTREICEIESTTYNEGAVGDFLEERLTARGWTVEKTPVEQPAENPNGGPRWNIYAGNQGETPDLVFSTHIDTVPPYIPFREDEEFVYGRGVCDAKGILAAQLAAAEILREEGYKVGMLFVAGEERDSAGARTANEASKGSRFLINGEPTDSRLALASKGALRAFFKTSGRMAHSAYPELGDSAIHKLVHMMEKLLALPMAELDGVGPATINIGQISGGYAPNVIADKAEAQVLIRTVTPSEPVRQQLLDLAGDDATVEFTLDTPFLRLRSIEGLPTMVAKFATDIPHLTNWGEPVLLGPGSIHVAHTPHEKLRKKELLESVDLYVQVAKNLLA